MKSLNEAVQIQADFVRENARANYRARPRRGRERPPVVTDGAKTVQAEICKIYGFGKQAA